MCNFLHLLPASVSLLLEFCLFTHAHWSHIGLTREARSFRQIKFFTALWTIMYVIYQLEHVILIYLWGCGEWVLPGTRHTDRQTDIHSRALNRQLNDSQYRLGHRILQVCSNLPPFDLCLCLRNNSASLMWHVVSNPPTPLLWIPSAASNLDFQSNHKGQNSKTQELKCAQSFTHTQNVASRCLYNFVYNLQVLATMESF